VLRRLEPGFDLIWLDPPYDLTNVGDALEAAARVIDPAGCVVLERATRREPDVPASLSRMRDVKSGDSTLTFLRRLPERRNGVP
jgi:16S rRNA G966 N2-methylase RsmD